MSAPASSTLDTPAATEAAEAAVGAIAGSAGQDGPSRSR